MTFSLTAVAWNGAVVDIAVYHSTTRELYDITGTDTDTG